LVLLYACQFDFYLVKKVEAAFLCGLHQHVKPVRPQLTRGNYYRTGRPSGEGSASSYSYEPSPVSGCPTIWQGIKSQSGGLRVAPVLSYEHLPKHKFKLTQDFPYIIARIASFVKLKPARSSCTKVLVYYFVILAVAFISSLFLTKSPF
jgi:hypothetical protein